MGRTYFRGLLSKAKNYNREALLSAKAYWTGSLTGSQEMLDASGFAPVRRGLVAGCCCNIAMAPTCQIVKTCRGLVTSVTPITPLAYAKKAIMQRLHMFAFAGFALIFSLWARYYFTNVKVNEDPTSALISPGPKGRHSPCWRRWRNTMPITVFTPQLWIT